MRQPFLALVPLCTWIAGSLPAQEVAARVVFGGGLAPGRSSAVTAADRKSLGPQLVAYRQRHGALAYGTSPGPYRYFPLGLANGVEGVFTQFVDLRAGPGVLDYDCGAIAYEGHDGDDLVLRTFEEQGVGVAVYAARGGVVAAVHDGEFDKNTSWNSKPSNYVVIDHGNGRMGYYWHLKKGSVAVNPGQQVAAGEVIGMAGSSGNSNYPHLHFASYDNGVVFEPFAGACRGGTSGWVDQPRRVSELVVLDHALCRQRPDVNGGPPHAMPRSGHRVFGDGGSHLWAIAAELPAASTWELAVDGPGGKVVWESGAQPLGNAQGYRWSWWWWWFDVPAMRSVAGTWHVRLRLNGREHVRAPLEIVPQGGAVSNRPPNGVEVEVDGMADGQRPARCRVWCEAEVDDPDGDVLRYRYRWRVNGGLVRDVTTAGRVDLLPAGSAAAGDSIQCAVSVGDGSVWLDPVADGVLVGGGMELEFPVPGKAGRTNELVVGPVRRGAVVGLLYGFSAGQWGFGVCPGLQMELNPAGFFAAPVQAQDGLVVFRLTMPPTLQSVRMLMQAVEPGGCEKSNVVSFVLR